MEKDVQDLLAGKQYRRAFERILDLYEVKVFRMAVKFLKNREKAEEITQEIFLKFWRALPSYDGRAAPSTWLYAIARNTCLSALRYEAHRKTLSLDGLEEAIFDDLRDEDQASNSFDLRRCIQRLPEMQRDIIELYYLQEKSVSDVAQMLDLAEGTVKSHLSRARVALAAMIEE